MYVYIFEHLNTVNNLISNNNMSEIFDININNHLKTIRTIFKEYTKKKINIS